MTALSHVSGDSGGKRSGPSRATRVALALLVLAPTGQLLAERFSGFPVGPARMLSAALCLGALVLLGFALVRHRVAQPALRGALAVGLPVMLLATFLVGMRFADGPFGPFPGGRLHGVRVAEAQPDWSVADGLRYAELEVHPARPRSLETLVLHHAGALYVAANYPEYKLWPHDVLADDRVVVRLAGRLYERRARRVDAPAQKLALTRALADKYGFDASMGSDMWFFRLEPRGD